MKYAASKIIEMYPGQVTVFTAVLNPETESSKKKVITEAPVTYLFILFFLKIITTLQIYSFVTV